MAKVTATNGSLTLEDRGTKVPLTFLFRTTDFMLERRYFCFHFTHAHVTCLATRLVEEVNNSTGQAAQKNDEKAHRANELLNGNRGMTDVVQHDLQNLFAQTQPGEANR